MDKLETTLCLLKKDNEILLAMKKRGFGEGKYNGVGGKLESGETPEQAMVRETQEEIKVTPTNYEKVGYIEFDEYYKGKKEKVIFHLYLAYGWEGNPEESEEMKPEWFNINEIPYNQMFPDDKYWLPLILEGRKIKAYFDFDEEWNLLSKNIEDLKDMSLKIEKSCGCIIIKNEKVLLVYEKKRDFWGFPKGHMEAGENEIQTALREVKEEVGLDVEIDSSKRYELNYIIRDEIDKTSVYYIASPKTDIITKQESEIGDVKWCSFEEALEELSFENLKEMFRKAISDIKGD